MSFKAALIKTFLKLPPAWLVRLSGGKPLEIGGRVMDPYMQFVTHGAAKQTPLWKRAPGDARQVSAEALSMLSDVIEPGVSYEDFSLEADDRGIPVRLYRPESQNPDRPMMVYMHMGGGVIGDLETCHVFCSLLASATAAPILSVDYRLAPEHKFPAGLQDGVFAYEWALKNAQYYGAASGRAAIGGDSMGGNFAAIITQLMRREEKPLPDVQLLIYPATDIVHDFPSKEIYGETYPLSKQTMTWFMEQYLPDGQDVSDVHISPALEYDLANLSPAIIATAGFDPLVDEGEDYAKRLEAAGVQAMYKCYDSLPHGFTAFTGISPAADQACRDIAESVNTAYQNAVSVS